MPIRPTDPAKRAAHIALLEAATAVDRSTTGDQPHPLFDAAGRSPDVILLATGKDELSPSGLPAQDRGAAPVTDSNRDENGDYLVGRNRPPVKTRWQPGQSGNPRGPKPRVKLSLSDAFEQEILAEFTVRLNGEDVTVNLGSFALKALKTSAAKGIVKAQMELLALYTKALQQSVGDDAAPELAEWEQQVLDDILKELGLPEKPVVRQIDRSAGDHSEGLSS